MSVRHVGNKNISHKTNLTSFNVSSVWILTHVQLVSKGHMFNVTN